jgi:hypothetical protein
MKIITTKVHGCLDYTVAILLIISPWALRFSYNRTATIVMVLSGLITILYSLITDYEYSVARLISMKTHLILDALSALLLIISPWLFGFHEDVYLPHVIFGIVELLAVSMSQSSPTTLNQRSKTTEIKTAPH